MFVGGLKQRRDMVEVASLGIVDFPHWDQYGVSRMDLLRGMQAVRLAHLAHVDGELACNLLQALPASRCVSLPREQRLFVPLQIGLKQSSFSTGSRMLRIVV